MLHIVIVCLPVAAIWLGAEPILVALKQPPEISALTARFLRWRVPALPFYALQRDIEWFLQCTRYVINYLVFVLTLCASCACLFAPLQGH